MRNLLQLCFKVSIRDNELFLNSGEDEFAIRSSCPFFLYHSFWHQKHEYRGIKGPYFQPKPPLYEHLAWSGPKSLSPFEKFYPRNINHMPPVKFFGRLDLDQNPSFLDEHYSKFSASARSCGRPVARLFLFKLSISIKFLRYHENISAF